MASITLRENIGNHLLRNATWNKPAAIYVAIFSVMPGDDGLGGTEVSTVATGYGRVQHGPGDALWTSNGSGQFANAAAVQLPSPVGNWGSNLPGFGLYTAGSGGTFLGKGLFGSPITVVAGGPAPAFAAGDLIVTIT